MNNGNGNGDMDLGGGFGAQAGGAVGSGGQIGVEADKPGSDIGIDRGLAGKFDIEYEGYTPPPESVPSVPPTIDDLTNAFSSPPPEPSPTPSPIPGSEWPSESRFIDTWGNVVKEVEKTLQGMAEARPGQLKDIKNWADAFLYGLLALIGITQPQTAPAIAGITLTKGVIEKAGEKTLGQRFAGAVVPEPTFASAWEKTYGFTSPATPEIETASPQSEGNLEAILFVSPAQKAPSSYGSPYYTGYQPLSMALFGAKEDKGLMIFPSSAGGVESEMSSLVKKQEPLINTSSLLFLMGMGLLGMVLRKGARA
jgi:hypothetical protein